MLFILTNSTDSTASFLTPILEECGISFTRLDTDLLISGINFSYQIGKPRILLNSRCYEPADVHHVWYRRPEQLMDKRFDGSPESNYTRSEWTEAIECFFAHVPAEKWINHPSHNAAASRKLEQLTTATQLGFKVPDTLVTQEPEELRAFYKKHNGQLIVKPLSGGYVERPDEENDSLIYTNQIFEKHLENLCDLAICPTLFQVLLDKRNDVRITVMDSEIHAVELLAADKPGTQRCDVRRKNMSDVVYNPITLPNDVDVNVRRLMTHYKLRFGAIDMAVTNNEEWIFFEINPNGQWAWLDMMAGTRIASSFVRAFSTCSST